MKPVLVSQRVDVVSARSERRDALDQRLLDWLAECDLLGIPVPNRVERLVPLWQQVKPAAVVLSGGNDLSEYGGDAPERDAVEQKLLALALAEGVPVVGVCRGAQFLLHAFGNQLQRIDGHVGTRHRLEIAGQLHEVNSFHQWGCVELNPPLRTLARSDDGLVEAFAHADLPILGVMWHPERETPFAPLDKVLLRQCLDNEVKDI